MTITDQVEALQSRTIDKERLRQKYLEERNKRLRPDGNDQYLQVKGQLAHYLDDPYTPVTPRAPKTDHVTFAFVGGGFAGLATAARISEAGIRDVRIIEKGGDFGGTWYWNRYPGAQCDTASLVLYAAAGRNRLHAVGEIRACAGNSRALQADRQTIRSL